MSVDLERNLVSTWQHKRPLRNPCAMKICHGHTVTITRCWRGTVMKIPHETIKPYVCRKRLEFREPRIHEIRRLIRSRSHRFTGIMPHEITSVIKNVQCHGTRRCRFEVVIYDRSAWRILSLWNLRRKRSVLVYAPTNPDGGFGFVKIRVRGKHFPTQLLKRRNIIEDPKRSAMRSGY